jgi:hypothetical protein
MSFMIRRKFDKIKNKLSINFDRFRKHWKILNKFKRAWTKLQLFTNQRISTNVVIVLWTNRTRLDFEHWKFENDRRVELNQSSNVEFYVWAELNILFLFERIDRVRVLVRRIKSNTIVWSTNWIEQTYLFVEHSIWISVHNQISNWAINLRIESRILFDELIWVIRFCLSSSLELARMLWF